MNANPHVYSVPDISCDHCKRAIESEVGPLDGVEAVTVDVDSKLVTVSGGDDGAIAAAIARAGYAIA
ncbi:MAG: heavy metal transporter [Acidimicrobiales bacterium]|nr:heavy metal transporter [Acidimicrobiales bacterium]